MPPNGGIHLTIKTSDQRPRLRRTAACGRACRRQSLTEKCGWANPRHDGQETSLLLFLENPEEELPASSSIVLLHSSRFDASPRFPRPLPFPTSSASSPTLVSAVALSALPLRCSTRIPATASSMCRNRHQPVLTIFTMRDAPMNLTNLLDRRCARPREEHRIRRRLFVGALKAEGCSHSSSLRFLQNVGNAVQR